MTLLKLFISFLKVGLFSFGGGLAAMPLIQYQVTQIHNWLTLSEFTDLITISEMTPGPIAINSATFIGIRVAGIAGAVVATLGCIFPSCIIVSFLAYIYSKYKNVEIVKGVLSGLRPAVVAMIATAGISILELAFYGENGFSVNISDINIFIVVMFIVALIVLRKTKLSPILVMLGTGIIGGLQCLF